MRYASDRVSEHLVCVLQESVASVILASDAARMTREFEALNAIMLLSKACTVLPSLLHSYATSFVHSRIVRSLFVA